MTSSPTIRRAFATDLAAVTEFLAVRLAGAGGAARYLRILDYRWCADKPDLGVLVEDGGRIRGFIGAIYADRPAGRFCNLTSIAVDEDYRRLTLQMFGALFRDKSLAFTCFSASEAVEAILQFFKFQHWPNERVVVGPPSGLRAVTRVGRVHVISDPGELDIQLRPDELAIARDHRPYRCGELLVVDGNRRCFVVTVRRGRGIRAFADVLYASDPELLVGRLPWIHAPLFRAHHTLLTGIDRRWVRLTPSLSFVYTKLRPTYVRAAGLDPTTIDALYSELVPISAVPS